jgi:uncharacterized caspase-like protein
MTQRDQLRRAPEASISPQRRSIIQQLRDAHGLARVLTVGVSAYRASSGFHVLKACGNDAEAVRDRFRDIEQLNADKQNCKACTSKSENPPTRGEILRLLHEMADNANSTHRIIFYYSGHGHRLRPHDGGEEFYLVPEDAYANDRVDALISFGDVLQILNGSAAKQKMIFLDACGSGPDVAHLKILPAKLSTKFLTEYLANAVGCVVITSCGTEEKSTTQSPNPRLSLFTHYLCEALGGNADALDNGRLTFDSLYSYLSVEVTKRANSYHQKQRPARTQNQ